jgi:adenosylmethionine-8-amino-7-oxononanoate aminotransferase
MMYTSIGKGVIARAMPHGDFLGFLPPLVSERPDIDKVVGMTKRAVDRVDKSL